MAKHEEKKSAPAQTVEERKAAPRVEEGWEEAAGGSDELWRPEEIGASIEGVYCGSRSYPSKFGNFTIHTVKTEKFGTLGLVGADCKMKFENVRRNAYVRVTYLGSRDIGKGSPMPTYQVLAKKGTGDAPSTPSTT